MARTFSEMIILAAISIVAAFFLNSFNPQGIPLFGQWDPSQGLVHAGGPCAPDTNEISDIDVLDLYLRSEAVFVDARSRDDFAEGHIPRSVSLPFSEAGSFIDDFLSTWPVTSRLLIYCSGTDCHDSHDLAGMLKEYGYLNISVYPFGFDKWKSEGRPIDKSEESSNE